MFKSLTLSKIFEKLIKKIEYLIFLNKTNLFSKQQFGFRSGLSTANLLFRVDNSVGRNIDKNDKVMGIFLDVQKLLDCVNHKLLLTKLEKSGIR